MTNETTPENADIDRRTKAQAACAMAIGFNQMAHDAKTLGEKVYARMMRDFSVREAESFGTKIRWSNDGEAQPPKVMTLEIDTIWIDFNESDIELMRACVAEHDARKAGG